METITALLAGLGIGLATLLLFTTIAFAIELNTTQKTLEQYRAHASRLVRKEYTTRDTLTIERDDALTSVEAYRVYCSRLIQAHNKTIETHNADELELKQILSETREQLIDAHDNARRVQGEIDAYNETLNEARSNEAHLAYALLECAIDECDNATSLVVCDECTDEMTGHYESVKER